MLQCFLPFIVHFLLQIPLKLLNAYRFLRLSRLPLKVVNLVDLLDQRNVLSFRQECLWIQLQFSLLALLSDRIKQQRFQ